MKYLIITAAAYPIFMIVGAIVIGIMLNGGLVA
jgi:type II secretory pathway component PulF